MANFIDRRLNAKGKSTVNRQRFIERYKKQIKKAVGDAVTRRSVTDIDKGEQISIPKRDLSEPVFRQGQGGIEKRNSTKATTEKPNVQAKLTTN
jgi:uncharacterized sporulation protein YeaH/YhbH (DUF444 family)